MEDIFAKVLEASAYINERIDAIPEIGIILGSGLGPLADEVTDKVEIPYEEIPNFPSSKVEGHSNKLIIGKIYDKSVIVMKGRFHYYEGYSMDEVTFPIRVFAMLGVEKLIVTNAAGGIDKKFKLGDLMLINDHINISGLSPLRGTNISQFGPRFLGMTNAYSDRLIEVAKKKASSIKMEAVTKEDDEILDDTAKKVKKLINKINVREGVYAFMPGPQYETKAEIKMLSTLGASAVGMSTVPEVIAACHSGMEVLGVSCITNLCFSSNPPTHDEVIEVASLVEESFKTFIVEVIKEI